MHAVVRSLTSPDPGADPLESYKPAATEPFGVFVEVEAGPSDGPGGEIFGVMVCSPAWLSAQRRPKGFEFVRSTLLVDEWSPALIRHAIDDLCRNATGGTWGEIAGKLSRSLTWEFEDLT